MANYSANVNALFPDLNSAPTTKKDTAQLFGKEVGVSSLGSFFAGIGSGFFKIPEGFVSLGANLIDLGADTNTAQEVEEFFAKINPFDEYAEATAAGRISEILTNIAVPVGIAANVASKLSKGALAAKKSGNYFKVLDDEGVPVLESLKKGQKVKSTNRLAQLNRKGQAAQLGITGVSAGAAEAAFVDDPEDVGSFGDLFGGPTQLDRGNDYDPERELYNRLKLGIEGTAFTGILSTAGRGIKQLADSTKAGRVAQTKTGKALDWVSEKLRPRSGKNRQYFEDEMSYRGKLGGDQNFVENLAFKLDDQLDSVMPAMNRWFGNRGTEAKTKLLQQAKKTILSNLDPDNIKFGTIDKRNLKTGEFVKDKNKLDELKEKFIKQGMSVKEATAKAIKEAPNEQQLKVLLPAIDIKEAQTLDKMLRSTAKEFDKKLDPKLLSQQNLKNFKRDIKKADILSKQERQGVIGTLNDMRQTWGDLLAIEGRSLDTTKGVKIKGGQPVPTGKSTFERWKEIMPKMITDRLDTGYLVFKNNSLRLADNVAPAKELIKKEEASIKKISESLGVKINNSEAKKIVNDIVASARLDKKIPLLEKGSVLFKIPNYFVDKSFASQAAKYPNKQLIQLTKETQEVANKLLGKDESVMSVILNGSNMLSTVVRRDDFYRTLLNNSNNIKVARAARIEELVKQGMSREEAARQAPIQTFFDTENELIKATGARTGDYRKIGTVSARGEEGLEQINPLVDRNKTRTLLKGEIDPKTGENVWAEEANQVLRKPSFKEMYDQYTSGIGVQPGETFAAYQKRMNQEVLIDVASINPLTGKWTLKGNADALYNVNKNLITPDSGLAANIYKNLILYPKATSQMAKTVLGPFTHMRNFLSAGAFATANGIIPFLGAKGAARDALRAIQLGPRSKEGNALYRELLDRGVVNSQAQLSDLKELLKDVDFGGTLSSIKAFNKLAKGLSKIKKGAQDAYTAEDDFWKIFSYLKEKDRLFNAYSKAFDGSSIGRGGTFINMAGNTVRFNRETIAEEAAAIVRNNIPNYAYVSDFVKGLRQYPIGNFVSFPAEILRTGTNIVQRGLDEIFYSVKVGKNTVNPLRAIGLQRLIGMGITTSAVPYAAVAAGQALYDVSQDELKAMRRYVARWSKNSTLIPLRGDDGKLKYIDFSHMNAYDTLTRPIQTVITAVQLGEQDKNGIMDDFMKGLFTSTKELAEPFISESIWTQALADIYMRGGETRDGFRVYNKKDNLGNQLYNSLAHLGKSQLPLNWKQLERLGLAMKPKDSLERFDERGRDFELGNEVAGMIGARAIEIEPEKAIAYKIADYARGTRQSKSLFTSEVLKGGVVNPEQIYDAYLNANRALFEVQKTMSEDISAARLLGMTEDQMETEVLDRVGGVNYETLNENIFRPMRITSNTMNSFQEIADSLGILNPLDSVIDSLNDLEEILSEYSLTNKSLPELFNPFANPIIPDVISNINSMLPSSITNNQTGIIPGSTFGVVPSNNTVPYDQLTTQDQKLTRLNKVNNYLT